MATIHELKERIRSVQSSQKITGAMRMIATSRLRKAEQGLLPARSCLRQLLGMYLRLQPSSPSFFPPEPPKGRAERVALVVFAAGEGMCGAFNINVAKKWEEVMEDYRSRGISGVKVYPVGKILLGAAGKKRGTLPETLPVEWDAGRLYASSCLLADALMEDFRMRRFDRVEVIYTYYKSMASQTVRLRPLLPFVPDPEPLPASGVLAGTPAAPAPFVRPPADYILEPGAEEVAEVLLPMLVRATFYEMCLSGKASEEASRILAMQAANDNARDLMDSLQLEYNKLRQQGITEELSDIFSLPL